MASSNTEKIKHFYTQSKLFNFKVTWKIENILQRYPDSAPECSFLCSPFFTGSTQSKLIWRLHIRPIWLKIEGKQLGASEEKSTIEMQNNVNIFLCLITSPINAKSVSSTYSISIIGGDGNNVLCRSGIHEFSTCWENGWSSLISRKNLEANSALYLPNKHLTLECCIQAKVNYVSASSESATKQEICSKTMDSMYEEELYCDMVLKSTGKQFKCHKSVLSSRSRFFGNLFSQNEDLGSWDMTDTMNDMELEDLLRFIYTGSAINLERTCKTLFIEADNHGLEALKVCCENELLKTVRVDTACQLLEYAIKNGANGLKRAAATSIANS